jgi:hypothetical protein
MFRKEAEMYKAQMDKFTDADGASIVDKMRHKMQQLTERVVSLAKENRALTSIQLHQEKQLLSDDLLEQQWPVQMAVLKQDLSVAKEQGAREQKKASELRKKGREQQEQLVALKETNKTLKEIQAPVVDPDQPIITEKELRQVEDELGKSRVSEDVLRKSAESFKSLGKRELALEKAKVSGCHRATYGQPISHPPSPPPSRRRRRRRRRPRSRPRRTRRSPS